MAQLANNIARHGHFQPLRALPTVCSYGFNKSILLSGLSLGRRSVSPADPTLGAARAPLEAVEEASGLKACKEMVAMITARRWIKPLRQKNVDRDGLH